MALKLLCPADWVRLQKAANYFAYLTRGNWKPEDLRHEALIRAMDGVRNCPRDVNIAQFLVGVMKSIISASAKAAATHAKQLELAGDDIVALRPEIDGGPEQHLIEEQGFQRMKAQILDLFEEDSVEQLLVEGIMEGMEGSELCELAEIDVLELATRRRFIRRTISKAFPNGLIYGG